MLSFPLLEEEKAAHGFRKRAKFLSVVFRTDNTRRPSPIKKLKSLRKQYAYYSKTSNGFGTILAGIVYWLIYIVKGHIGPGILNTLFTVPFIGAWLVGKEVIRRTCYQTYDVVEDLNFDT